MHSTSTVHHCSSSMFYRIRARWWLADGHQRVSNEGGTLRVLTLASPPPPDIVYVEPTSYVSRLVHTATAPLSVEGSGDGACGPIVQYQQNKRMTGLIGEWIKSVYWKLVNNKAEKSHL
jgi:hypothetical protein